MQTTFTLGLGVGLGLALALGFTLGLGLQPSLRLSITDGSRAGIAVRSRVRIEAGVSFGLVVGITSCLR